MIIDITNFPIILKIPPLSLSEKNSILAWAGANGIAVQIAFGNVYFKEVEHATLFKLRFGL